MTVVLKGVKLRDCVVQVDNFQKKSLLLEDLKINGNAWALKLQVCAGLFAGSNYFTSSIDILESLSDRRQIGTRLTL